MDVQRHWGIENRLYWVRDVVFGKDRSQVTGMLRLCGVKNIAAALRQYGWKPWETLALIGLLSNN